ncbi:DNA polymerase zeta catalytic subunit [Aspergillus campestris IBT 28561]|uniref:DNA polymerase n=1 Tax=Aspergillus campestris (strain IBT 28561) TaxID=1392248 RepID=A0A2I1DD71_ASPC2|nr:DNA polymerase zeta catalytic subunit [Aspergillus campestris IBT 28561]PKY07828.1 DNA polymerase zeta catalytic subunit [Aspergillus campestris IBT 28561]
MDPFQVRLNCVDHYQAAPSEFDPPLPYRDGATGKYDRPKVPVIRVFGATETGQKVCVHIHGAFPYLYVEYTGDLSPEHVSSATRSLHLSIDRALAVSYRRNEYDKRAFFVAHITLVKGVPFYGYHVGYRFYFKIYLLNPIYTTRLADLLLQGAVLKRPLQPYESHLQYIPQWMCDYSLFGCAIMKCGKVKFRSPVPEYMELSNLDHRWHDRSINPDSVSGETDLPKQSHCPLEVDVHVQDILNRVEIRERDIHHDFTELFKSFPSDERLVPSMAGLWQDESRRRKKRLGQLDPGSSPFRAEDLVSFSSSSRNQSKGGWIHEDEFRDMAAQLAAEEKRATGGADVTFDNYLHPNPLEKNIKTAMESVEDLFADSNEVSNLEAYQDRNESALDSVEAQVNEDAALSAQPYGSPYCSDDEDVADIFSEGNEAYEDDEEGAESMDDDPEDELLLLDVPGKLAGDRRQEPLETFNGHVPHASRFSKRRRNNLMDEVDPRKRGRILGDTQSHSFSRTLQSFDGSFHRRESEHGEVRSNEPTGSQSSQHNPPASQLATHFRGEGQKSKLNFPVVKDPNDPMTILRFSQDGASPLKATMETAEHSGISQPLENASKESTHDEMSSLPQSSLSETKSHTTNPHVSEMATMIRDAFNIPLGSRVYCLQIPCPTPKEVSSTLNGYGCPSAVYQKAFYSNESDVPDRPRDYAGREFRLEGNSIHFLPDFDPSGSSLALMGDQPGPTRDKQEQQKVDHFLRESTSCRVWEFAPVPPSRSEVVEWFKNMQNEMRDKAAKHGTELRAPETKPNILSQIEGPTQANEYGFKYSQKKSSTNVEHQAQYMSVMSLEVHVNTRGILAPNPDEDEITGVFWAIKSDDEDLDINSHLPGVHVGMVFQGEGDMPEAKVSKALRIDLEHEPTELDLLTRIVDIVRFHDPDIITGYEVHNSSWGYLIERARKKYDYDMCDELSRVKAQARGRFGKDADRWGFNHTSSIRITGRHIVNIWRAMKGELNLLQYTMENVVFHLLHRRTPHYSFRDLTDWFKSGQPRSLLKVIGYFVSRVQMNLEIIDSNELISRTSEQARLLGIDFFSVVSRGSQFKVESLMFRIAKPENFLLVSPSKKQVGQQNALECLPLVMEPQSDFYTSPLLVLDFQSLYPSIMIAYNYCYSTFLGRARPWMGRSKMGFTDYERQPGLLELFKDKINIAPNGMMYAKPEVRTSLLARMLAEILETRVMVKAGMKEDKDDKALQRLLNNRQLALKLIANVTYGYTSASFSGRMPCSEIADSIVQSGRETLEKAIAFIHSVDRWGAEVVYGDTDSLFVYLKGRTREQAFDIGDEIAKAVTEINPRPVKLKFEKVYHPCVLLAKKRYVGFKYEHRDQKEPVFDAKGIETVRRDGTPAEQKIEEKALKLLFRTADLSQVKKYFQKQCTKIMQGNVSIQDFCFARAVRLGTYSERGLPPPGALISTKKMLEDPRQEPQYGERVPYVVVTGAPGSRLIDRCVSPETLLSDAQLDLDAEYYITKNLIPPLERIFNLVGANIRQWYDEMPKVQRIRRVEGTASTSSGKEARKTLESYMKSSSCVVCKSKLDNTDAPVCAACMGQPHVALLDLTTRQQQAEKRVSDLHRVCRSCMGVPFGDDVKCDSKDCPVFYSRTRHSANWRHTRAVLGPVMGLLENCESGLEW